MTREKAIRHFERYVNDDCYTIEHREACRMAIDALREQEERENPKPLTLDELLKMHGEPVWVVVSERALGWYLVDADCECVFRQNGGCTFDEIVNHGAAYRSKPKEDA